MRLNDDRPCVLVIVGALEDGTKELIAICDGERESKLSWKEVLSGLKRRGLTEAPELAIGDGALGFWAALREEYPSTRCQRCWAAWPLAALIHNFWSFLFLKFVEGLQGTRNSSKGRREHPSEDWDEHQQKVAGAHASRRGPVGF